MDRNLKTRREHLKVLPLQKRLQAIEAIRLDNKGTFKLHMDAVTEKRFTISGAFMFFQTRQDESLWYDLDEKYFLS